MTDPNPNPRPPSYAGQVALGFFGAIGVDCLFFMLGSKQPSVFIMLLFIGLSQWIWLFPAAVFAAEKGKRGIKNGILIAGAVVFLLNAGFWGTCFFSLSKI